MRQRRQDGVRNERLLVRMAAPGRIEGGEECGGARRVRLREERLSRGVQRRERGALRVVERVVRLNEPVRGAHRLLRLPLQRLVAAQQPTVHGEAVGRLRHVGEVLVEVGGPLVGAKKVRLEGADEVGHHPPMRGTRA